MAGGVIGTSPTNQQGWNCSSINDGNPIFSACAHGAKYWAKKVQLQPSLEENLWASPNTQSPSVSPSIDICLDLAYSPFRRSKMYFDATPARCEMGSGYASGLSSAWKLIKARVSSTLLPIFKRA